MELGVTIPLQKFLGWRRPPYGDDPRLLFCWEIHRVDYGSRKLLAIVNAATCFAAFRRMNGADWKRLDHIVPEAISQAMDKACIPTDLKQRYFDMAGEVVFTRTHGRRSVAGLNRVVEDVRLSVERDIDPKAMFQMPITRFANNLICHCATRTGYVRPCEAFLEDLGGLRE